MGRLIPIFIATVAVVVAVLLYPVDCDAAFAVHDAIWYGVGAETFPAGSITPHHPLFHVLVIGLTQPLRALGVSGPGHVAARIVAGLGGAWLLVQVCLLAGRRRVLVGAAFALLLFATRGFIVEMASGENVLPAAAAALFALTLAARPDPNLWAVGAALTVAGLLRQDNVFVAPGVALAVATGLPGGKRFSGLMKLAVGVGIATAIGYLAAWQAARMPGEGLAQWLVRFGSEGAWTGPKEFGWGRMPVYFFSIALAITGRIAPPAADSAWIGLAWVPAILLPGLLLRGTQPLLRLGLPILVTLTGRAFFHAWYEADNFEWLVLPVALLIAFSTGITRGEPATPLAARRLGALALIGLVGFLLFVHGPWTWRLRERTLMTAIEDAADVDRSQWRFLGDGSRVVEGLQLLGIPRAGGGRVLGTCEDLAPRGSTDSDFFQRLEAQIRKHPVPTVVIYDRFVMDGMPWTAWSDWTWGIDSLDASRYPGLEILRRGGRAFAGRWIPPGMASPPDTRSRR